MDFDSRNVKGLNRSRGSLRLAYPVNTLTHNM